MRYKIIPSSLFIENRRRFTALLPANALCVIHSNDTLPSNADSTRPFIQNSDFFWLTGIDQPESVLVLFPGSPAEENREMLFVKPSDEHSVIWEGPKLSKTEATEISGITHIHWLESFNGTLSLLMAATDTVYLLTNPHAGRHMGVIARNHRFVRWCRRHYPLHAYHNAATMLHTLRTIKSSDEIILMRKAADITRDAILAACRTVQPGVYEYEIEAECTRAILRRGARGFAYEPIIASGANSCILHYVANDRRCADGEIVLIDLGASYANYAADVSRTLPVNGRFTPRQRAVYDAVLRILREASAMLIPGTSPKAYHEAVDALADKELVNLGLISMDDLRAQNPKEPARKKYFLHRTTHYLGIDVHDPGDPHRVFEAGMVFTCEPGIYIRDEGIGIRLENNFLITAKGNEDLTVDIPIEAQDIEALVLQR